MKWIQRIAALMALNVTFATMAWCQVGMTQVSLPGPQSTIVTIPNSVIVSINATQATGTLPAAQMIGVLNVWTCASACTMTTDTATNIIAALGPGVVGGNNLNGCLVNGTFATGFVFTIRALTSTATIAAGTGVTLAANNTNTVATANARTFVGVVTNCATPAVTIYTLGTAAY